MNEFGFISQRTIASGLVYKGTWDALLNIPFLASGVGVQGEYYIVSVAGTTNLDGITDWQIGDWAVFNGTVWQKIDNSAEITGTGVANEITYWTGLTTLGSLTTATYPSLTELSYVKGVTSSIQTQLNGKQDSLTLTTLGTSGAATLIGATLNIPQYQAALTNPITGTGVANEIAYFTGATAIGSLTTVTYPSLTELSYVKGVTSGIQTQLNAKQGTVTLTTTGTSGAATFIADTLNIPQYQGAITLTTTGSSGPATLIGTTLNIPDYGSALSGYVPTSRTLTINGTGYDLTANRTWSVGTVTSVSALTLGTSGTDLNSTVATGTTTPVITLNVPTASALNRGALSNLDWIVFNAKQNAITLTTTGTSGAATLIGATLNIPQYQSALTNPVTGTGTTNYVAKFTGTSTIGDSVIYDNGTNVGIGTSSPSYKLDVDGGGLVPLRLVSTGYSGIQYDMFGGWALYIGTESGNNTARYNSAGNQHTFYNSSNAVFTIYTNDNIGINDTAPASKLSIKGSGNTSATYSLRVRNSSNVYNLQIKDNGSVYNLGAGSVSTNTAFGDGALIANTFGSVNTAIGANALGSNTFGSSNTAVGRAALSSNILKSNNTAIGYQTMRLSTDSEYCVAVGDSALYSSTSGSNNTAVGSWAGYNILDGSYNTLFGRNSGDSITSGNFNTAVGYNSLISNFTGGSNVGVGAEALMGNSGSYNAALGTSALQSAAASSGNTAIGNNSLYSATGDSNTAVGRDSGTILTTGTSNTFIGISAGTSLATVTNSTALGAGATVDTNNTMVFGNTSITENFFWKKNRIRYDATNYFTTTVASNGATTFAITGAGTFTFSQAVDVPINSVSATPTAGDSSTKIATTAFVQNTIQGNSKSFAWFIN